jgi:hypothetical protein
MLVGRLIHATILGSLLAGPVAATDFRHVFPVAADRSTVSGYGGITISIASDREHGIGPSLRLGAGLRSLGTSATATAPAASRNMLVEVGSNAGQGANLQVNGRRLAAEEDRRGLGAGGILLAVAAVAAATFLVVQLSDSDDNDDEQCLIEPEFCD